MNTGLQRDPEVVVLDDHQFAQGVLERANGLSRLRRRLVVRRLRRLTGSLFTELAHISVDLNAEQGLGAYMMSMANEPDIDTRQGLMHRALSQPPDSPLVRQLEKELGRLAGAR